MRKLIGVPVLFMLLCPAALPLSFTGMDITGPAGLTVVGGGTPDVTFSGSAIGGYDIAGELCGGGFCGGAGGPTTQPATVHLTDLTVTCVTVVSACGPLDISFFGTGLGIVLGTTLDIIVSATGDVNGTAPVGGSFHFVAFSGGPNAVGDLPFALVPGPFSLGPVSDSTSATAPGFGFNGFLHLNTLALGQTFHLGSSFDAVLINAPEPGGFLLLAGGLMALAVRRRR